MCRRECDITPSPSRVSDARRERTVWHERACGYIRARGFSLNIILTGNIMEKTTLTHGLNAEVKPWRPWVSKPSHGRRTAALKPYERPSADQQHFKVSTITHPVKLFWPKSQCFDYLYQDAEILLRNYPVQATICLYEDSDTDDDDDDEDEEDEKELN
ncbi:hypothetical protein ABG768_020755 [Culter alburnus]|uniref:Protein ripply2 n=1 Tax=Culter alburnus TaxID=194366 RepID=A0AAW2ASG7_CULAL